MSPRSNGMRRWFSALRQTYSAVTSSTTRTFLCTLGVLTALTAPTQAQVLPPLQTPYSGNHVLTHRYNNQRTGVNPNETFLTPQIVKNGYITPTGRRQVFGKLFSRPLDGDVFAQPLYVSNVPTTDPYTGVFSLRNVVYVCTANNSIYAYDADNSTGNFARPYWQRNFNYPLLEILPVSSNDIFPNYLDIAPVIGIISTPVIDLASQTLYVVVRSKEFGSYYQRLYALDLATGQERTGPANIAAAVEGTASEAIPDENDPSVSRVHFDQRLQNQHAALLLANGNVYIAWGSHAEEPDYHGWIMAYNATTLEQVAVFNTTPDAQFDPTLPVGGGVFMGASGLAADTAGNIFAAVGSGTFDVDIEGRNYGSSILKLRPDLTVADYFTPFNHPFLSEEGYDLSTGGVVVLPSSLGSAQHPDLLLAGGLEGRIYLLDRTEKADPNQTRMGGFNIGFDQIVQSYRNPVGPIYGAPAYFNGRLYYNGAGDVLKQFLISGASINPVAEQRSTERLGYPGASPVISANGNQNGIVWTLTPFYPPPIIPGGPEPPPSAILYAHDANDVSQTLFNGQAKGETDVAGPYTKYSVPVVVNGKVYAATNRQLSVYGMRQEQAPRATRYLITGPNFIPAFLFLEGISEKTNYSFQITAIGPNQQPVRITTTAQLTLRDGSGALRSLATLRFNNQSTIIHTRSFPVATGVSELIVTDRNGTYSSTLVAILPYAVEDSDRYTVRMKSSGRVGEVIPLTVTAVSANGTPIQVFDISTNPAGFVPRQFLVLSTIPEGSQDLDFLSPGFAYDIDHPDPLGPLPELFFESQVTLLVRLRNPGQQVFVVTDGIRTGTAVINVRP
jgi:hypothetical protein